MLPVYIRLPFTTILDIPVLGDVDEDSSNTNAPPLGELILYSGEVWLVAEMSLECIKSYILPVYILRGLYLPRGVPNVSFVPPEEVKCKVFPSMEAVHPKASEVGLSMVFIEFSTPYPGYPHPDEMVEPVK